MKLHLLSASKLVTASVLTVAVAVLEFVVDGFSVLVRVDMVLIFGVGVLFMLDWITGVAASLIRRKKITSDRLGQTILKGAQYGVFISVAIIFENLFMASIFSSITDYLVVAACFYVSVREALSILENIGGGKVLGGMRALYRAVRSGGDPDDVEAALDAIAKDDE